MLFMMIMLWPNPKAGHSLFEADGCNEFVGLASCE